MKWLRSLPFALKLSLISIPAIVFAGILLSTLVGEKLSSIDQMERLRHQLLLTQLFDDVAHQHAVERGLTAGFLGSGGTAGKDKLAQQRNNADAARQALQTELDAHPLESEAMRENYRELSEHLKQKASVRQGVDRLIPNNPAFVYYSALNSFALDSIELIENQLTDSSISDAFFTYRNILLMKERAGQIRGKLNGAVKRNQLSEGARAELLGYIISQNAALHKVLLAASASTKSMLSEIQGREAFKKVAIAHNVLLDPNKSLTDIPSSVRENWFALATENIKAYKGLANSVLHNMVDQVEQEANLLRAYTLTLMGVSAAVLIVLLTLVYLLSRDLSKRVKALQDLLHRVEQEGDLDLRARDDAGDELGDMAKTMNSFLNNISQLVGNIQMSIDTLLEQARQLMDHTSQNQTSIDAQLEETRMLASAVTEMSASFNEVAHSTQQAANLSNEARSNAAMGQQNLGQTSEAVHNLSHELGNAEQSIEAVNSHCKQIASILDTIQDIAEQTNLLALNAAIEAARAGEQGRGFAVVADEVRSLAQRTQSSTGEINSMISNLNNSTQAASSLMQKSRGIANLCLERVSDSDQIMNEISHSNDSINGLSEQIAAATEEQSNVAEEVTRSVTDITGQAELITERASALAQQSQQLENLAETLSGQIQHYQRR